MREGFLRVAAAVPVVNVADVDFNVDNIISTLGELEKKGVEIAVFPEMCVTAYTCGDLFHSSTLLEAARRGLVRLVDHSMTTDMDFIVGLPVTSGSTLYNCAAHISHGQVDLVAKTYIPNYNEFYERRWWKPLPKDFEPICLEISPELKTTLSSSMVFLSHGTAIGIEICEDLWAPVPPSCDMAMMGATVIFNLSASDDLIGKYAYLRNLIAQQSGRTLSAYVYASAGWGESSTDLTFDGKAIIAENGSILAEAPRWTSESKYVIADIDIEALEHDRLHNMTFSSCRDRLGLPPFDYTPDYNYDTTTDLTYRQISPTPFVPADDALVDLRCEEIINIQAAALARRLDAIHCRSLVVGISGGLDSTLALLVAVKAFDRLHLDRKGITGITMPGFGTTSRTHNNAIDLMEALGVTSREIPIGPAVNLHFADIGHDPAVHDVTYENSQARERTQILMDVANQTGGIVLGTGDLSELALGWATYNGDQMSMYGVNAGVPKTLVRYLVKWEAGNVDERSRRLLLDICDTPISPELIPADSQGNITQKTEDLVGPYELHDFFIYYTLRYGFSPRRIYRLASKAFDGIYTSEVILKWMSTFFRRFFSQQFKRSCMPDGPKVGSVCLSPRGDWRMPSDASSRLWLAEIESLKLHNS
ncbi:MAG: NAD(+) synthase [Lachnoclostridium sp.]|nr:NAD(+) synthase [Lachnoclostridium sp.]